MNKTKFKKNYAWIFVFIVFAGIAIGYKYPVFGNNTKIIGDIYLKLLEMCVYPIIFLSVVRGFSKFDSNIRKELGGYLGYWICTAFTISVIGVILGIFSVMRNPVLVTTEKYQGISNINVVNIIGDMVPNNIFAALVSENIMQIVVFSFLFGLAYRRIENTVYLQLLSSLFDALWSWLNAFISIIVKIMPVGIFFVALRVSSYISGGVIPALVKLLVSIYSGYIILVLILYPIIAKIKLNISPLAFYQKFKIAVITAFFSCSSGASYPFVINAIQKEPTGLVDAIGGIALILKHANCLQTPIYYIWGATCAGYKVSVTGVVTACVLGILTSMGTAGVPGGGVVMIAVTFEVLGIPLELVAVIASVYSIIDMPGTVVNVVDDCLGLSLFAKKEYLFENTTLEE